MGSIICHSHIIYLTQRHMYLARILGIKLNWMLRWKPLLWCYSKNCYFNICIFKYFNYWSFGLKFRLNIPIFPSQTSLIFFNFFCPIKALSVTCCPETPKWLINTTTATKQQTVTSMHVRCICVILVGLRGRRWGWSSESCEQTNERQAQIQPQVADAEPGARRAVPLL